MGLGKASLRPAVSHARCLCNRRGQFFSGRAESFFGRPRSLSYGNYFYRRSHVGSAVSARAVHRPEPITADHLQDWICEIEHLPARLRQAIAGLTDQQLDTPYRPGGWTIRQVVHHFADSHINAYTRFRLALTEDNPIIKPYDEAAWAKLPDATSAPVDRSLSILDGSAQPMGGVAAFPAPSDWKRTFRHPEYQNRASLEHVAGMYAWHCRHHVAHINALRERANW